MGHSRRRIMTWAIIGILGPGALSLFQGEVSMAEEPAFFADPPTAVGEITRLMRGKSWAELARYYDLSGTDIDPDTLVTGAFFVRAERPAVGHPAGFGLYKQPFAPGFSYLSHQTVGENEVEVTVDISIDQGGGMIQRGLDTFRMRQSERGYQILPKNVE